MAIIMIEGIIRIGIYGGTFSPPHNGHVAALKAFMRQMKLDYAYVIPAAAPPHKEIDKNDSPAHRLEMCRKAFGNIEGVVVSDIEIRRGGKSYTVDTLRELKADNNRLFLLCGTDMIMTLGQWYLAPEIFKLCYPIYIRREKDKFLDELIMLKLKEYTDKYNAVVRKIVCEPIELSSTEIRADVKAGRDISAKVPLAVAEYIYKKGLYV